MFNKILHILLVCVVSFVIAACDSNQEKHQKTLEERLVDSFEMSDRAVRDRVQVIVTASKERNYKLAMNELGILSATQINTPTQKHAIKLLMEQLRFNLEEGEIVQKQIPSRERMRSSNS